MKVEVKVEKGEVSRDEGNLIKAYLYKMSSCISEPYIIYYYYFYYYYCY